MLGPIDYALWIVGFLVEIGVGVCVIYRKEFIRYLSLTIYLFSVGSVNCVQYLCIARFGFSSPQYFYCYSSTASLLIILLFWTIIQFYQQTFREMSVSGYIRGAAVLLLLTTALFSYIVVHENRNHLTTHFVVELGQ